MRNFAITNEDVFPPYGYYTTYNAAAYPVSNALWKPTKITDEEFAKYLVIRNIEIKGNGC